MNQDLVSYYADRAKEYEKVYLNPNEQEDLQTSEKIFQDLFANKKVLEIACGTGYWTERISQTATSIFATDINESVIEIARARQKENITFTVADMFDFRPLKNLTAFLRVLFGVIFCSKTLIDFSNKPQVF